MLGKASLSASSVSDVWGAGSAVCAAMGLGDTGATCAHADSTAKHNSEPKLIEFDFAQSIRLTF
jgi:hypothetical protein